MPPEEGQPFDLLDLKLLPAWVKESPEPNAYAHYEGEEPVRERGRAHEQGRRPRPPRDDRRERRPRGAGRGPDRRGEGKPHARGRDDRKRPGKPGRRFPQPDSAPRPERPPLQIAIRFVPHPAAFENVAAQIKSDLLAYSVFSLARLFLQKPERYDVHLAAKPETPLYQLGESGTISADRAFLENNAFRFAQQDFYKIETSQADPIKGNFNSVARERTTGTVLGPTNYHDYQRKLRALYEQRFSRRMTFSDFQKQIEIVNDPALVEKWKEDARTITNYTTSGDELPVTFTNASEAERHFRAHHLAGAVRQIEQTTVDGVTSRTLTDRILRRAIEDAWSAQTRSPSQMMAELSNRLREAGLHIFRHRKGMLFVTPVRVRPFVHEETSVSPHVRAILDAVAANPKINRKDLAGKVIVDVSGEEAETRKLALASDLRWLISEGFVIEFNDGSLDLPRAKVKPVELKGDAAHNSPAEVAAPEPDSLVVSEATALSPTQGEANNDVSDANSAVPSDSEGGSDGSSAASEQAPASARQQTPDDQPTKADSGAEAGSAAEGGSGGPMPDAETGAPASP